MAVALVGSGPARDAVEAALGDVNTPVADVDPGGIGGADLAIVTGQAGDPAFETADATAGEHGTRWLAVEIGGLAGYPVVEGAVSGFGPETGCYQCLAARVRANTDPSQDPQAAPDPETARYVGAIAGRAAVQILQGRDETLLGGVVEVPYTERQFLPVPHCDCAGEDDQSIEWTETERDVETALAHAEIALDERVGVVSEVGEAESFPVPYYLARIADTSGFSDATAARNAAGVDADWNVAFMKALGEGLERYCAGVYRTETFEVGRPSEIENAVPPSAFVQRPDDSVAADGGDTSDDGTENETTDDVEDQLDTDLEEAFDPDPDEVFEAAQEDADEETAPETGSTGTETGTDTDADGDPEGGDGTETDDEFVDAKPEESGAEQPTGDDLWEDGEKDGKSSDDSAGEDDSADEDETTTEEVEATLDADASEELEADLDDALAETMGDDETADAEEASAAMESSTDGSPEGVDDDSTAADEDSESGEADGEDVSFDDAETMDLDAEPETVDVGDVGADAESTGSGTLEVTVQGPETEWTSGQNLSTGETVALPAEFVYFPPPSEQFRPGVTTGLGLGNSTVEATLSGLYEVIERDAMMLSWYSTFEPLELAIDDDAFGTLVDRARSEGLSVTPLLLTQDVDVPVVAVAVHREEWPKFALGSGAHLDPTRAATAALAEAIQNWLELRGMGKAEAADADGAIGEYADLPEHAAAFIDAPSTVPADSVGAETVPSGRAHVDAVVDRLTEATLSAYVARTTTRDVDALGFEAVRVLVPAAQPLFFGEPYFGERAETVPRELGFVPRLDRPHHPFP